MEKDRRTAYLILKEVEKNGEWANLAADRLIKKEGADSPAFVRELVYGVLRNRTLLDWNIDKFLKKSPGSSERIWLRMGFYQLALMDGVKDHAAINETVELARSFKKGSENFINAVLRNFQRSGSTLLYPGKNEDGHFEVRDSVHSDIAKLWIKEYGFERAGEMLFASNGPAPLSIRLNSLKTGREALKRELEERGYEAAESPEGLTDSCLYVKGSGLLDTGLYKEGLFSVQGESSQYAVRILDPKPGSTVIDLCAAPGGKSCAIAERMKDEGRILAFDLYEHRIKLIEKEASRLGIDIIEARAGDSSVYCKELDSVADYVIADVPCSGLGTLREHPEIKYRPLSHIDVQGKILENALRYVKPGGYVLYSTCTVNPEENEDVVKSCNLINSFALGSSYEEGRDYRVIGARQLITKAGGHDGFFICLIQRRSN